MKKVCVVTGTRAEFGLMRYLIEEIKLSKVLQLQLVATGTHLSKKYGETYREILASGFKIVSKVDSLLDDNSPRGIAKSVGLGTKKFADVFHKLKPDVVIVLGDRFEILSAVVSAMFQGIPIAHIHGGESTEGLIDDQIRNSITKMSHLHFVAAKEYHQKVNQMGEQKKNIFNIGGLGVDVIKRTKILTKSEFSFNFKYKFGKKNYLVTFHPVTLEKGTAKKQAQELVKSLNEQIDANILITFPNADAEGYQIYKIFKNFAYKNKKVFLYKSLGYVGYISALKHFDCMIGNSSSGLLEAPTFKKPTINIGSRQDGRLKAKSVIDCKPNYISIKKSIKYINSKKFQKNLFKVKNPYGNGGASKKIVKILEKVDLSSLNKKKFYVKE